MTKPLFLHIGLHKTGSTSVQRYFSDNQRVLLRHGILYPEVGVLHGGHHEIAWSCGTRRHERNDDLLDSFIAKIVKKASSSSCRSVVISSEEFESGRSIARLANLSRHFEVRVVAYIRKQDELLESQYNQHLRQYDIRFAGSIYQFALKHNFFHQFNFRNKVERWAKIFGEDSIIVRPYGTELVDRDVCRDFLSLVAPSLLETYQASATPRDNVSLPAVALPYLARLNALNLSFEQHQRALDRLSAMFAGAPKASLLSFEESAEFFEKFEVTNTALAKKYLHLDSDPLETLVAAAESYQHVLHSDVDEATLLRLLQDIS